MTLSFISRSFVCFVLCAPLALSLPGVASAGLDRRLPPTNDPDTCLPPLVSCERACCASNSLCAPSGLCKPGPPPTPPQPGQLSVTYSNDKLGRPCVMNIHGQHFNTTVDIEIQMVVNGIDENPWSDLGLGSHTFDINTGWQDCSKTGKRSSMTDGYAANVYAWDDAYVAYTGWYDHSSAIPVRVTANGICP